MQGVWAIIPVKRFGVGKSRLAPALDAGARAALSRRLFEHAFKVAASAVSPGCVIVVTPDATISDEAGARGAHGLIEPEPVDLNAALGAACRYAVSRGATAVAVLPSDLPFITAEDFGALIGALGTEPGVAIAPDTAGHSTNALALAPPDPMFFRFGSSSFEAHRNAARAVGADPVVVQRPGFAFDLDTPEDLQAYRERMARPS